MKSIANLISLITWILLFAVLLCSKAHQKAIDCCQQYVHYTHGICCFFSINNALKTIHGINTQKHTNDTNVGGGIEGLNLASLNSRIGTYIIIIILMELFVFIF